MKIVEYATLQMLGWIPDPKHSNHLVCGKWRLILRSDVGHPTYWLMRHGDNVLPDGIRNWFTFDEILRFDPRTK